MQLREYDLCVVGSGLAGLNALKVASDYLPKNADVILIDKNKQAGGMWNDVYDYVRLHQPFQHFTAGNIKWKKNLPPGHLANKIEVLDHLNHCLNEVKKHFNLECVYEHEMVSFSEEGHHVEVEILETQSGQSKKFQTKKLVKAYGANIKNYPALKFSSNKVRSLVPHSPELFSDECAKSSKPIYIVGGGKTAMDIAYKLIKTYPEKEIKMLIGEGTNFINRDVAFPRGFKKYWGGTPITMIMSDLANIYIDCGIDQAMAKFKQKYALNLNENCKRFFSGIISPEENETIKNVVSEIHLDYLDDIIEVENNKLEGVLKSKKRIEIEADSWVINCTGYFYHTESEFEPYLSKQGKVLSIQQTSAVSPFSSFGAYYLSHVFFMNKAHEMPYVQLNHEQLHNTDKDRYLFICFSQIIHNVILSIERLPLGVMTKCDLNFDSWFPFHRQVIIMLKLIFKKNKLFQKCKDNLEEFNGSSDIKCEPLPWVKN